MAGVTKDVTHEEARSIIRRPPHGTMQIEVASSSGASFQYYYGFEWLTWLDDVISQFNYYSSGLPHRNYNKPPMGRVAKPLAENPFPRS